MYLISDLAENSHKAHQNILIYDFFKEQLNKFLSEQL